MSKGIKPKTILVKKPNLAQTDYYRKLAAAKFGVPYESVTKEMRANVKTWELAKSYGSSCSLNGLNPKLYFIE